MRYTSYLSFLALIALTIVGCGGSENNEERYFDLTGTGRPVTTMVFADQGSVDLVSIPAGRYQATRVRSYSLAADRQMKTHFEHRFKELGRPRQGDWVRAEADWGTHDRAKSVAQFQAMIDFPLLLEATGKEVKFTDKRYYRHSVQSSGAWRWDVSGGEESVTGVKFYEAFSPRYQGKGGSLNVYKMRKLRATAFMEGQNVRVIYESPASAYSEKPVPALQVIEIFYAKQ